MAAGDMAVVGTREECREEANRESSASDASSGSDSDANIVAYDSDDSLGDHADYPAMVWDVSLSQDKGITTLEATLSLMTSIIGAGIMALPMLPKMGGINAVIIFAVFGGAATAEAGGSFFKAYSAWNKSHKKDERIVTYEGFGVAAMGRAGGIIVRVAQIGWFVGACSGYVVLMVHQLQYASGLSWGREIWIAILGPALWFLCMLRDISAIAKLVPIAVLAAVGSCGLIMVSAWKDSSHWEDWSEEDIEKIHSWGPEHGFMSLGSVVATLLGAFAVMGSVPPIVNEMKHPKQFPKALKTAILVVTGLYLGVIVIGYWGYGNFIQSNILISMSKVPANATEAFDMPPSEWTRRGDPMLPTMLAYCVLVNLLLSYPLCLMSVFASIQGLSCANPGMQPGTFLNYLMRTGIVCTTLLIGGSVPDFGVLFSLFASVCGPFTGIFCPIVFGAMIRAKIGAKGSSPLRWFCHTVIMLLGAFCLIIGFMDSLNNLLKSFSE